MKTQLVTASLLSLALSGCITFTSLTLEKSCAASYGGKPQVVKVKFKEKKNEKSKIQPPERICVFPGDTVRFKVDTKKPKNGGWPVKFPTRLRAGSKGKQTSLTVISTYPCRTTF